MKKSKNNITESYRRLKNILESNSSNIKAINIT
ncbi:MAG: hypothetical protein K0R09_3537, partial [Clostridiales bacterium]|nr:hypothetical protein [Clostridiales bacterium]